MQSLIIYPYFRTWHIKTKDGLVIKIGLDTRNYFIR